MTQQQTLFNIDLYNAPPTRFHLVEVGQRFHIAHYHMRDNYHSRGENVWEKLDNGQAFTTRSTPPYPTLPKCVDPTQQVFVIPREDDDDDDEEYGDD